MYMKHSILAVGLVLASASFAEELAPFPTWSDAYAITKGPHEHLFASYFAIDSWSPNKRYVSVLETDLNGRLPEPNERCTLGLVDLQDGNKFIPVTTTACWNFQEAAMAHWIDDDTLLFNDVRNGKFVTVIMNWKTKAERILPLPVSAVSEDRTWAVSINYARLSLTRPDYGYAGPGQDPREDVEWPEDDGLWVMDLKTGEHKLILSVAQGRSLMPATKADPKKPGHPLAYYCHTIIQKDKAGSHFNWAPDGSPKLLVTAAWDGHIKGEWARTAWSPVEFTVGEEEKVRRIGAGVLDWDWHCIYSPDGKFMSGDTYWTANCERPWVLVRLADGMTMPMGAFFVPEPYRQTYWRCDLHARYRPDGKQIGFNSVHEGSRQVYLRDIKQ